MTEDEKMAVDISNAMYHTDKLRTACKDIGMDGIWRHLGTIYGLLNQIKLKHYSAPDRQNQN